MDQTRYGRQSAIIPFDRLSELDVTVIGVGAIGRQVALQLAAVGVQKLSIIDHDVVEITNLASQGYHETDLQKRKVDATQFACQDINSKMLINAHGERFNDGHRIGYAVFCCVDSIDARREIFKNVKGVCRFFCDGRMAAEALRVLTVVNEKTAEYYETTLFSSENAYPAPCTAKATIYCANAAAAFMVTQFAKYLRNIPVEQDISINLLTTEVSVVDQEVSTK